MLPSTAALSLVDLHNTFPSAIPVQSFQWSELAFSGGTGTGRPTMGDVQLAITPTTAEANLLEAAASGETFSSAVLSLRDPHNLQFLTYTLTDVHINNYQTSSAGGAAPSDSLALNFGTMTESYTPVNNGTLGTPVVSSWNQATLQAAGTGKLAAPDATGFTSLGVVFDGGTSFHDEIPVGSYTWSESNGTSFSTERTSNLADFQLNLAATSAEPTVMADLAAGMTFKEVVVHVRRNTQNPQQEYLTYTLSNVHISSYQTSFSDGNSKPSESLTLSFGAIRESYTPFNAEGKPGTPVVTSWNTVARSATGSGAISQPPATPTGTTVSFNNMGEIPLASFQWSANSAVAGKSVAADFQLTLASDNAHVSAEPGILVDSAAGRSFGQVVIHVRLGNSSPWNT